MNAVTAERKFARLASYLEQYASIMRHRGGDVTEGEFVADVLFGALGVLRDQAPTEAQLAEFVATTVRGAPVPRVLR